jgi:hypothetical protein
VSDVKRSRIFERLKDYLKRPREIDLTKRDFPVNYSDYVVSWDSEFQRRVIEELIERPKRERRLRDEEYKYQDKINRERLRKILEQQQGENYD